MLVSTCHCIFQSLSAWNYIPDIPSDDDQLKWDTDGAIQKDFLSKLGMGQLILQQLLGHFLVP